MTKKTKLRVWLLLFAFAVLLSVPFLIPGSAPLALVSLVPLFLADKVLYDSGAKHCWLYFLAAFLAFNVATTFWIWYVSQAGAVAAIFLNSLQMALVFGLFRWFRKVQDRIWPKSPRIIAYLFLTAAWLAWEHVYFNVEISWPWLVLGNAFATSTSIVQWYSVTGALGGTLWIFLTGIFVFLCITAGERRKASVWMAVSVATAILPIIVSLHMKRVDSTKKGSPCEVVVIQPNIDPFSKYGILPQARLDHRLMELAESYVSDSTRFVITPETFTFDINIDNPSGNSSMMVYADFFERHPNTEMLLGALTYRTYTSSIKPTRSARRIGNFWYDSFNTAMITDGKSISSHYFKSKLVPGVEIIPYQNVLKFLGPLVAKFGGSSDSYGTQDEMDALAGRNGDLKVGAMICYESIYGDYSRMATKKGANFLAVMTNDGWWGDTPGYRQHFRFARLRAIENRRYVVHAANTGISGVIDRQGNVLSSTRWWEETAFRSNIECFDDITHFVKYGDVIGLSACRLFLLALAVTVLSLFWGKRSLRGRSA